MEDSPQTARRREREKRVISQMIGIYCAGMHKDAPKTQLSFARDYVCEDCAQLDAFAVQRTEHCASMQHKTNCEECGRHCYSADMRKRIRAVMRFAGPRMICQHPIEAVRHLLKK